MIAYPVPVRDVNAATTEPFVAFTICSRNFLAQAQLLYDGLSRNHPGIVFYAVLCDDPHGADIGSLPFSVICIDELGIPRLAEMIERYNITELNTALKPFGFLTIFDRHPGSAVVYFDPDIWVMSPLEEIVSLVMTDTADCVLTPHVCEPAEFADMDEGKMLQYGIYNLGFCLLRDTEEVRRITSWWGRRLETQCIIDLPSGLFVDQKWADLLPAFIKRTTILRHPGYNVAYWNLAQRTLRAPKNDRENIGWKVNDQPLRFFHFSGSAVDDQPVFSRHSQQFKNNVPRDVNSLFRKYCAEVRNFGRDSYRRIPYAYRWNGVSGKNEHSPSFLQATSANTNGTDFEPLTLGVRPPYLPTLRAHSLEEMNSATARLAPKLAWRRQYEASLVPLGQEDGRFSVEGECVVCGGRKSFNVDFLYAPEPAPGTRKMPNWREHINCPDCGLWNRLRAALHLLWQEVAPKQNDRIYITEQLTPLYNWLGLRFPHLIGSEYLGPGTKPGEVVNGIRHEDIQNLSFPDESLDLIMSFDVLEHVPDERSAFAELARCLRPGGTLFFTAPFSQEIYEHKVRAILQPDGSIKHLMKPEYHGNPVDPEGGSLCFRYYGWKMLDDLAEVGFADAEGLFYWSERFMYLGDTNSLFIARKAI